MNPEMQYPELKNMKENEMFVEWVYIVKPMGVLKLYIKKIIPKKERNAFVKALKVEYGVKEDPDDPTRSGVIELATITK